MSQVQIKEVASEHAGQRLDNFLLRELKGVPRTRIYRALRKGEVRVNKGRVKADYRLERGDLVRIPPLQQAADTAAPPPVPRRWQRLLLDNLVFETDQIWVLNKPSGLAVHGGSGLSIGLIECLRQLAPAERFLELVHRLDRDTSGCIMVARKPAVLKALHRALREDAVQKRYLALVKGHWPDGRQHIDMPLRKNTLQSGERMVRVDKAGKPSVTEFSVVERFPMATLVEARPLTGRTHQIRVHAQQAGCPILGDAKYGDDASLALANHIGLKRLFLHAASLRCKLPEIEINASAPLEPSLEALLSTLRAG
ncbi:MAG: RluA family pseudouridine synthase [Halieaceae bacterium]|jgi:23S rRNA pseudouridine955/2504/2580 synthase|nr:RluA family pseudouridine synthase [Halieaceae bacterium]